MLGLLTEWVIEYSSQFYPVTDLKQGSHEMCARISENQCVVILLEKTVEIECYYFNRWTSVAVSLRFIIFTVVVVSF